MSEQIKNPDITFKAVKTPDCYYLAVFDSHSRYERSRIDSLLFDGKKAEKAFKENWVKVNKLPKKVETIKEIPKQVIFLRLPDRFQESELMPRQVTPSEIGKIDSCVRGIYEHVYSELSYELTEQTFSIDIIGERGKGWVMQVPKRAGVSYDFFDVLSTHPDLLFEKPCKLSSQDSLNLLGEYLRTNVDPAIAKVEFDKNYRVNVKKFIKLHEKKKVTINIGTSKRPKYKERFYETEETEVFSATCSEVYKNSHSWIVPFEGKNAEDLERNITNFLEELTAKINTPQRVCECCKGFGVILDVDIQH